MKTDLDKNPLLQERKAQIVFFLYFLVTLVLVAFHEPWEDELQAWCIARDLSVPEICHQMRYEGHFALWYLLLKPLAFFCSEIALNLTSWLLVSAAVMLFLSFRRFGRWFKTAVLLSSPVLYWFPVVSRNYALIPLALVLLAGLYPVRLKRPWAYAFTLLLLVHSHAYMEGLAGILGLFFGLELILHCRRMPGKGMGKVLGILLLLAAGVAAAYLQVAPAFGTSSFAPSALSGVFADWNGLPVRVWGVLMRLPGDFAEGVSRFGGKGFAAALFYLFLLAGVLQLFLSRGRAGIFFLAGFFWQVLFAALIYPMALHRVYLPLLMLIFCFALPVRKKLLRKRTARQRKLILAMIPVGMLAVMTWPDTLHYASADLLLPFSNQQQAAWFIKTNLPEKAKIVVFPASLITGTFRAYLPERTFYRCSDGQPFRVFRTVEKMPEQLDPELLEKYMGNGSEVYLLFQMGAFLEYRFPTDSDRLEIGDFVMETVFCTFPKAFFPAGEDYALFRVTRRRNQ